MITTKRKRQERVVFQGKMIWIPSYAHTSQDDTNASATLDGRVLQQHELSHDGTTNPGGTGWWYIRVARFLASTFGFFVVVQSHQLISLHQSPHDKDGKTHVGKLYFEKLFFAAGIKTNIKWTRLLCSSIKFPISEGGRTRSVEGNG